jgi:signal transduction histidine kinase
MDKNTKVQSFYTFLRNGDYEIIGIAYPVAAITGFLGYLLFYILNLKLGIYENLPVRLITAVVFLQLIFFSNNFTLLKKVIVESILGGCIPLFYSYFYFATNHNILWAGGLLFGSFTYGFLTGKSTNNLIIFPLAFLIGFFIYDQVFETATLTELKSSMSLLFLAVITSLCASLMKLIIESTLLNHIAFIDQQKRFTTLQEVSTSTAHNLGLEKNLKRVKKLNAAGSLLFRLVDDFSEKMQRIENHCGELKNIYASNSDKLKRVTTVQQLIKKSSSMINGLAIFTPVIAHEKVLINVHTLIEEICRIFEESVDKKIQIVHKLTAAKHITSGFPSMLEQAFINICINGFQAMTDGGVMLISSNNTENDDLHAQLILSFSDSGIGMTKDIQANLFKPFFSTKESGHGNGIGLMMVDETIRHHNGSISVISEPGKGTTFQIILPVSD